MYMSIETICDLLDIDEWSVRMMLNNEGVDIDEAGEDLSELIQIESVIDMIENNEGYIGILDNETNAIVNLLTVAIRGDPHELEDAERKLLDAWFDDWDD